MLKIGRGNNWYVIALIVSWVNIPCDGNVSIFDGRLLVYLISTLKTFLSVLAPYYQDLQREQYMEPVRIPFLMVIFDDRKDKRKPNDVQ